VIWSIQWHSFTEVNRTSSKLQLAKPEYLRRREALVGNVYQKYLQVIQDYFVFFDWLVVAKLKDL